MPESPTQSTNLQGQTLADGRFHIVNLLGSGGMADVYRAYDNATKQDIAVKMPKLHLLADAEFVRRFDREVTIMKGLQHPHIVPVLFAGKHEGHTFAVFPYLTGGSLGDRIKSGHKPAANGDLYWLMQIAMALDYLHGQGLLHRDVKPDNIMFDAEGKAYLSDFGIVRALEPEKGGRAVTQLTAADMTIGTAPYMALELLLARTPYTGAVDQYALAVTLYEALTGRKPYNGSAKEIVFEVAKRLPQPLAELRHDLPPLVGEAVHRALSRKADKRFANCIEFAKAVVTSLVKPTARRVAQPALGKLVSGGETVRAPTQQPTRHEANPGRSAKSGRAAGVSRRSAPSATSVSSTVRAPFSPPANAGGSPRRWWIAGASVVALIAVTLLFVAFLRPEKRDTHVEKNKMKVNPPTQQIRPEQKPPDKVEPDPTPPVVKPKPKPKTPAVKPKLEKYITILIGMKLVLIPAGKFMMGSPDTEKDRDEDESPQHEVHITKPFYIGVYEVTQAQYKKVMGDNPSWFSSGGSGKDKVAGMDTSNFPVETVSWNDAVEFCKQLSNLPAERAAGRVYRLPSEAEWEYTCRGYAPSYQVFQFGNSLSSTQANFDGRYPYSGASKGRYLGHPTTVGSYQANAFAVYDMHGNLWEWCTDWFDAEYYGKSPIRDPLCLTEGSGRVIRGGSWVNDGRFCRAAYRHWNSSAFRHNFLGFRIALVPSGE